MIRIVTDSVSSLPAEVAAQRDITVVPLFLHFDGAEHVETQMNIPAFYETLEERIDAIPTSSQPSAHQLEALFEEAAQADESVVGAFLSSALSGTFEGAVRAARMVKSHHIDFECVLIDSASAGYDEAFCTLDAADARDQGASFADVVAAAEVAVMRSRILFVPDSLAFLKAGGRIGSAAALLGQVVRISPILTVKDGYADTFAKVRTHKRALAAMVDQLRQDMQQFGLKRVVVHYIGKKSKALDQLREAVEEVVGRAVEVLPVSPVLGAHVGPAVGIAYECLDMIRGKLSGDASELVVAV
ncbi:DegV family protein [Adlercreutzia murintestinalis]|uniref:DegV family protein n=1 Tax=Adlercreutzia murintestinalis TaxID=2941325 RepID=UPI00203B4376|nr:DegV family protein [Adlercreutzia murintestinalis]